MGCCARLLIILFAIRLAYFSSPKSLNVSVSSFLSDAAIHSAAVSPAELFIRISSGPLFMKLNPRWA